MPLPPYQFFTSGDAARVSKLQLTARRVVEGVITGQHRSPHRGFSVEFSAHREYTPGDELRHLDWRAYARSDRHYVKLYEQETNLRAMLVLDSSASMAFGNKLDYARHLCACLAYLLAQQQDQAGLVAVDDAVRAEIPPASAPAHLDRLFRVIEQITPGGKTNLPEQLHALVERLPRRSLVIVLSDLWVDPADLQRALQHLRYRQHQAMVLHLLDRAEMELPYDKAVTLTDMETGERVQVDPREVRESYQAQIRTYLAATRRACSGTHVEYHALFTDVPYERALIELLNRRR